MSSLMFKSEYATMYRSEERFWWYVALRASIKYIIHKYAVKHPVILDAGCGTGKNIEFLSSLGYDQIEGFDYSEDAIDFCRLRGLNQVKQASISSMPYNDKTFDIVCCTDVFGSLEQQNRDIAVQEFYRVLKPGGIIIANSAALEIFRSQHDEVANINTRFTATQFKDLFGVQNAKVLKLSYRVFLLSPLVLLFKLTKRLTGLFKSKNEATSDQIALPIAVNWLFLQVQLLENKLFEKIDLPFGSSIFIVVQKQVS